MVDSLCYVLGVSVLFAAVAVHIVATFMMLFLGKLLLFAAAVAVYLLSWCLGARCCCDCRSLAVLAMLSLSNLVLASAVYCRSFAVLVLSTAVAAHLLLAVLVMLCLGARFCYCCRSFVVLVMLYRANLVLSAAAASIY
ncbi:hypothetical protein MAM1_1266c11546 [Mucor ambiguus]|uniref:Uncharacterized protein n=1 Tax=Mucor ambiguus TaxID=91626 RepID=A0A0C9LZE2_9FUNG|nr:hypothetical protein MAM1_1266c11546 [Mucor ambiguus]